MNYYFDMEMILLNLQMKLRWNLNVLQLINFGILYLWILNKTTRDPLRQIKSKFRITVSSLALNIINLIYLNSEL